MNVDQLFKVLHENLPRAIEGHEAGFYFEEGGCWAFAIALKRFLADEGIRSQIRVGTDHRHAYAAVGGKLFDHQGAAPAADYNTRLSSEREVASKAVTNAGEDRLEGDIAWATQIIRDAVQ